MQIADPEKRLGKFWGKVDQKHITIIRDQLCGTDILDMGCGFGSTTSHITRAGYNCIGIDNDQEVINNATKRFPQCNFQYANAEQLPFSDKSFDTIILRDALHHFYGEADFDKVSSEILRVAKNKSRIIFFDPNINFLLKTMRKISFHKDEECKYETALNIMDQLGYKIIHSGFNTVYSLPLSGGYVGFNFVPDIPLLHSVLLNSERRVENLISKLYLSRYLCWRYIIVGEK